MAGKGTISVNQTPQYGDKTAIERLKSETTVDPRSGALQPRPSAGRPSEGGQAVPEPTEIPQGERGFMADFAKAAKLVNYWTQVNQAMDTAETRMNLADAREHYLKMADKLRNGTPFPG